MLTLTLGSARATHEALSPIPYVVAQTDPPPYPKVVQANQTFGALSIPHRLVAAYAVLEARARVWVRVQLGIDSRSTTLTFCGSPSSSCQGSTHAVLGWPARLAHHWGSYAGWLGHGLGRTSVDGAVVSITSRDLTTIKVALIVTRTMLQHFGAVSKHVSRALSNTPDPGPFRGCSRLA